MAATVELKQCEDVEQVRREGCERLIGKRVILALGKPSDLLQVQVRELWDRHYRVNIYVGSDAVSARVANSYFLEADADGNITRSAPTIKHEYGSPAEEPRPTPSPEAFTCA